MNPDKKIVLTAFDNFLSSFRSNDYGKCYFKLVTGEEYQGWISEINATTFEYLDSGPLAHPDPIIIKIDAIDLDTLAYFDVEVKKWIIYFEPNKFVNRQKSSNKKSKTLNIKWSIKLWHC